MQQWGATGAVGTGCSSGAQRNGRCRDRSKVSSGSVRREEELLEWPSSEELLRQRRRLGANLAGGEASSFPVSGAPRASGLPQVSPRI